MSSKLFKYFLAPALALIFIACSVFTPKPALNPADVEREEQAVYSTFFSGKGPVVILKETSTGMASSDPKEQMGYVKSSLKSIASDTIQNFIDRNAQPSQLAADMNLGVEYVLLNQDELSSIMNQPDGWGAFYQKYPNSHGYTMLSRVGFNSSLDQAVVYVGNLMGSLAGTGYYYLLVKKNSKWLIQEEVMVWIS